MPYDYTLEIRSADGRRLDRTGLAPDWGRALEWVRFEGIRAGRLPARTGTPPGAVEPVWDGRAGEPVVAAFRAVVHTENGDALAREIPRAYVRDAAERAAARLVEEGCCGRGTRSIGS
jgi:hypothetical protein